MRRAITVLACTFVLIFGMAGAALAGSGPKHGSCQGFGQVFVAWAQGDAQELGFKNGGQGIKHTAHNGLFIPGEVDAEPPGSVAEVVHWEHSWACAPA